MNKHSTFYQLIVSILLLLALTGCTKSLPKIEGHIPLSSLVKRGYAINPQTIKPYIDKSISLWGYLDSHNISLKSGVLSNQPVDWDVAKAGKPSGFMLKARLNDKVGEAVSVQITGDIGKFRQVFEQIHNARENPQVPILVTGILRAFNAPINFRTLTTLVIEVESPANIKFLNNKVL